MRVLIVAIFAICAVSGCATGTTGNDPLAINVGEMEPVTALNGYPKMLEPAVPPLCDEAEGEALGQSGFVYSGGCPVEAERAFLTGYIVGRRLFAAKINSDRAQRELRTPFAEIDFHADKVAQARARMANPSLRPKEREEARRDAEEHRQMILLAEAEAEWLGDRQWDAAMHKQEVKDGLAEWRGGEVHNFLIDKFVEAYDFARTDPSIGYCTDVLNTAFFVPNLMCSLREGGSLIDVVSGKVCVTGPAEMGLVRRGYWGDVMAPKADFFHSYNVWSRDENGRQKPRDRFVALFDGSGNYVGARCPELEEWP